MHLSIPRTRLAWLGLGLFIIVLVGAACAPGAPGGSSAPLATAPSAAPTMPVPTQAVSAAEDIPTGVDADGNFYRGNPNAPVKLVEFSDFQCPFCARHVQQTEPALRETYVATGQVLHVFRHFPLNFHANALPAAKAAYCAGQQQPAFFWALHDWLFANQASWQDAQNAAAQFRAQALTVGADGARYDSCLADPGTEARIQQDVNEGAALGVSGTPAFFVNEWYIEGAFPLAEFQDKIAKATQGLRPPATPTPLPQGVEFFDADPARPGFTYDGSPTLGASNAPVVVILFEDFTSKESATHVADVEPTLKTKYVDTQQARLVFKFFPLTAPKTAVAALCAARQGKFWDYRGLLYQKQSEWQEGDDAKMLAYAKSLGLTEAVFSDCIQDAEVQAEINTALKFGQQDIGVPVTPSYLVLKLGANGQVERGQGYPGALSLADFENAITSIQAPPTPTPAPLSSLPKEQLAAVPMGVNAEGHFYRGDLEAPIRLEEFSDFQCPYCARHAQQTEPLLFETYIATGKVVAVFKNFPLDFHPNAVPAAKAAYCAGQQAPELFWAMHDWLFTTQNTWSNASDAAGQFRSKALAIGADAARYDACLADANTEAAIQKDLQAGKKAGVSGTPGFFLTRVSDGKVQPISGALPFAQFDQEIKTLLGAQ